MDHDTETISTIENLMGEVHKRLVSSSATLATAESCTGGLIAKLCTDRGGSSQFFLGGIVSYSNDAKTKLLAVPAELIQQVGAVSEEVAKAMAISARLQFGSTHALSTTGIAGPGGGTTDKPIGTVWIAYAGAQQIETQLLQLKGDRSSIRYATAEAALRLLLKYHR